MRTFKIKNRAKEKFEVELYAEGKRLAVTREVGGRKYVLTHKATTAQLSKYDRLKDARRALKRLDDMPAWDFKSMREWYELNIKKKRNLKRIVEEASLCQDEN